MDAILDQVKAGLNQVQTNPDDTIFSQLYDLLSPYVDVPIDSYLVGRLVTLLRYTVYLTLAPLTPPKLAYINLSLHILADLSHDPTIAYFIKGSGFMRHLNAMYTAINDSDTRRHIKTIRQAPVKMDVNLMRLWDRISLIDAVPQQDPKHADIMLLTCMDYRFTDAVVYAMAQQGHLNQYDHFVLAGSSLGYNTNPQWEHIFDAHIDLAIKLHGINTIYVFDHEDCGAYRLSYGTYDRADISANLTQIKHTLKQKYPAIECKTFIMRLDKTIESV